MADGVPPKVHEQYYTLDPGAGTDSNKTSVAPDAFGFGSPAQAVKAEPIVKQLDFGASTTLPGSTSPATPAFKSNADPQGVDYYEFVADTLLWKNPIRSVFYLVLGLAQCFLVRYTLTSKTPIISGVCFLLLLNLGINFLLSLITRQRSVSATWSNSRTAKGINFFFTEGVHAAAAVLDKHLSGSEPVSTLQVAVSLWFLSLLARAISLTNLLFILHIGAFTVPKIYSMFKAKIDKATRDGWSTIMAKVNMLNRNAKVLVVAVSSVVLALLVSRVDIAIAVLVVLIFIRTLMQPNEVTAVSQKVAPVTDKVAEVAAQLSGLATKTAARFDLTPTPSKKKKAL